MSIAKVLFRVDAGPGIGLGHLQRSLALAAALQTSGVESLFLGPDNSDTGERIGQSGFASDTLPKLQPWSLYDARATQDVANGEECSTVIVDSHQVGPEYLANLRNAGLFVALRDDMAGFPFPCQLVINGNADAKKLRYASSSGDTGFLLGIDYMVLGREFWDWPSLAVDRPVENVLVTLGGTDEYNLMPQILETLDRLPGGFTLTAIVGPFFENVGAVEQAASRMTRNVKLSHNPPSLHDAIMKADLAVSAAGQTLYELARAGCPTVALSVASNQESQMENLAEAGFLQVAGSAAKEDVIRGIGEAVRALLDDPDARSVMASAGRRLVDGQGGKRVAQAILEKSNSFRGGHESIEIKPTILKGQRIFLRPLETSDVSEEYLSWLNDQEVTRYLAVGNTSSTRATLLEYLERFKNGGTDFIFAIVDLETGLHIGNVTLNHINWAHRTAETGLMIGQNQFWGRGYATEAWSVVIDHAFGTLGMRKIIAGAAFDNKASIGALKKLGFKTEGALRNEVLVDGRYQDLMRLGLFQTEFRNMHSR